MNPIVEKNPLWRKENRYTMRDMALQASGEQQDDRLVREGRHHAARSLRHDRRAHRL